MICLLTPGFVFSMELSEKIRITSKGFRWWRRHYSILMGLAILVTEVDSLESGWTSPVILLLLEEKWRQRTYEIKVSMLQSVSTMVQNMFQWYFSPNNILHFIWMKVQSDQCLFN